MAEPPEYQDQQTKLKKSPKFEVQTSSGLEHRHEELKTDKSTLSLLGETQASASSKTIINNILRPAEPVDLVSIRARLANRSLITVSLDDQPAALPKDIVNQVRPGKDLSLHRAHPESPVGKIVSNKDGTLEAPLRSMEATATSQPWTVTQGEIREALFYQRLLLSALPVIDPVSGFKRSQLVSQEMNELQKAGEEKRTAQFGTESQKGLEQYKQYLLQRLQSTAGELSSMIIQPPEGLPIAVPRRDGQAMPSSEFLTSVARGESKPELGLNKQGLPDLKQAENISALQNWLIAAGDRLTAARLVRIDEHLNQTIKGLNAPEGWLLKPGENKESWRGAAIEGTDLVQSIERRVKEADYLARTAHGFQYELPPGVFVKSRDRKGNIVDLEIKIPDTPNPEDAKTANVFRLWRQWLREDEPRAEQAIKHLQWVVQNPHQILGWKDTEVPAVKDQKTHKYVRAQASFDECGHFKAIVDPTKITKKPPEIYKDMNLLEERFKAHMENGKVVVENSVQAQLVPNGPLGYQNMWADNVGAAADTKKQRYEPNDYVAVDVGTGIELMQAKDLIAFARTEKVMHYGSKAIFAALDVGMAATGSIEVLAATRELRALSLVGGEIAGQAASHLAKQQAAKLLRDGAVKAGAGSSGFELNSAAAAETESGRTANFLRGLYFSAGGVAMLGRGGRGWVSSAYAEKAAAEQTAQAQRLEESMNGLPAVFGSIAKHSNSIQSWLQLPMIPISYQQLQAQLRAENAQNLTKNILELSLQDKPLVEPSPSSNADTGQKPELNRQLIEKMKSETSSKAARLLLEQLENLPQDPGAVKIFKERAESNLSVSAFTVDKLLFNCPELVKPGLLRQILDPEVRKRNINRDEFAKADQILSKGSDPELDRASRVVLLMLAASSRVKQSNPEQPAGTRAENGPASGNANDVQAKDNTIATIRINLSPMAAGALGQTDGAMAFNVDRNFIASPLLSRAETAKADSRTLSDATVLAQSGAISAWEYAALIKGMLLDPSTTKEDKTRILCGSDIVNLPLAISAIREQERDFQPGATKPGETHTEVLTADDLQQTLRAVIRDSQDKDLSAMAAFALYGDLRNAQVPGAGNRFLAAASTLASDKERKRDLFAEAIDFLDETLSQKQSAQAASADEERSRRLMSIDSFAPLLRMLPKESHDRLQRLIDLSLSADFLWSPPKHVNAVLPLITQEQFARWSSSTATAVREKASELLLDDQKLLRLPGQSTVENDVVNYLGGFGHLYENATTDQKATLRENLKGFLNGGIDPGYSAARIATIRQLIKLGDREALQAMRESVESDPSPAVRGAGLQGLQALNDQKLPQFVATRLAVETDIGVLGQLEMLRERLQSQSSVTSTSNNGEQISQIPQLLGAEPGLKLPELARRETADAASIPDSAPRFNDGRIAKIYPHLQEWNSETRNKFFEEKGLSLLIPTKFAQQASTDTASERGFFDGVSDGRYERKALASIASLKKERDSQWRTLLELATGDRADEETVTRARRALADVVMDGGNALTISTPLDLGKDFGAHRRYYRDVYYRDARPGLDVEAAKTLVETTRYGSRARLMSAITIAELRKQHLPPDVMALLDQAEENLKHQ
jgi:hypothetical protein